MVCGLIKISKNGARREGKNKSRCVSMYNQKGIMYIILAALIMAYSISVIMLVDELIADLLNIHNQQFLLSDNELSQLKGLQTLA